MLSEEQIERFLRDVDQSFPIPLSQKQNLNEYAKKLFTKATICTETDSDKILAMVAGYTDAVSDNRAYIALVATVREAQGQGLASRLIKEFVEISKLKNLDAVHLYAVRTNTIALQMYDKLGFVEWNISDEARPDDVHLIHYIKREGTR